MLVKLLILFYRFFFIGLLTIGGGYAMVPMIIDTVTEEAWLSFDELMNFIAIAESTPGPFAVNVATLVGFTNISEFPVLGAIVATVAVVLPSFIIIIIIARYFNDLMKNKYIVYAIEGIKAVVVGLIFGVVFTLVKKNLLLESNKIDYYAIVIIIVVFACSKLFKKLGPIPLIIISGLLGFIFYNLI